MKENNRENMWRAADELLELLDMGTGEADGGRRLDPPRVWRSPRRLLSRETRRREGGGP